MPAAVALLSAAPAEARTAYFKVSFRAVQQVTWKEDVTTRGCGEQGTFGFHGGGRSRIVLRTRRPQPVALQLNLGANLSVTGTYAREGKSSGWVIEPGDPHGCGATGEVWEPDCGVRRYPAGARLQLEWLAPERWTTDPAPLAPAIRITGPFAHASDGSSWLPFRNCKGFDLAGALGVPGSTGPDTGAATLPAARAFGRGRRFTVTGHAQGTRALTDGVLTGARTVTTRLDWTLRFTRVRR